MLPASEPIEDAVANTIALGVQVLQDIHFVGPRGNRVIVLDAETNHPALHSNSDA